MSTSVCTVNSHANGGLTTGNGYVEGIFGGRNLCANTIRGGTVETPGILNIISNVEVTNTTAVITHGTVVINSTSVSIGGSPLGFSSEIFTSTTTGTGSQEVSSFDKFLYRGSAYTVTITDNNANGYQINKLLVLHSSGDAYVTDYSIIYSNNSLGSFTVAANSTHVVVNVTPTSANTTLRGEYELIEI